MLCAKFMACIACGDGCTGTCCQLLSSVLSSQPAPAEDEHVLSIYIAVRTDWRAFALNFVVLYGTLTYSALLCGRNLLCAVVSLAALRTL